MAHDLPQQVLNEARAAFRRGAHGEALEKYLWFHHNALAHNLALAGVRLSYALAEWIHLGSAYPPARTALESIQNENRRALEEGTLNFSQFNDFAAINKRLGRYELTCSVFAALAQREPEFAKKCFPAAVTALVRAGEFALARPFVDARTGPLDKFLTVYASFLNQRDRSRPWDDALIGVYATRVRLLSRVLEGAGELEEAGLFQAKAIGALEDSRDQDDLRRQLTDGNSLAPH